MKPRYKAHYGKGCPVQPMDKVEVVLRAWLGINRYKMTTDNACALYWEYDPLRNQFWSVVAYRVIDR